MDDDREELSISMAALAAEAAILAVIAGQLAKVDEDTTQSDAYVWHVAGMADIAAIAATLSGILAKRSERVFDAGAGEIDRWAKPMFAASGRTMVKVSGNPFAAQSVAAGKAKAAKDIESMCRTSVLRIIAPDGNAKPIADAYREALTMAVNGVSTLEGSYTQSIDRMLMKMSRGGVRVQYPSGVTRELYSAISMNVMDNYRMTMQEARNEVGRAFGADGVEVSAHGMCAEDHAPYQGHQYTNEQFAKIQASLERPIAQGLNCRHQTFPIIMGVSKPSHSDKQLMEYREQSNRKVTVAGKTMTAYEFTQRQRAMEASVRKLKAERMVLSAGGSDTSSVDEAIKQTVARYRAESNQAGVETREERMSVYEWKG